ncbi:substrate-binding domain-containing protein [Endozoicomonas sp.]|uniref:substrate-binding domain-containing protein n=1 Tax=Endozoicomonas sp. TaxID=1892382 RepID=UPI003AF7E0F0
MIKKLFLKPVLAALILYPVLWCTKSAAEEYLFTIHGSNTVGAELAPALAAQFLDSLGAEGIATLPGYHANESRVIGFLPDQGRAVSIYVAAHGSSTGFKGLHQNKADIAAASRRAKPDEKALLRERGNLHSEQSEYVIGIDGLAIIVHPDNPINSLGVSQVARLFAGEITNWQQLGGPDLDVIPFARDDHSGTWDTFNSLVFAKQFRLAGGVERFESNEILSAQVKSQPGAVGFVSLNTIGDAKALLVEDTAGKSLAPTVMNVSTEDYILSRRLYMYMPGSSGKSMARSFLDFVVSSSGQSVVSEVGYVAQKIVPRDSDQSTMPDEYLQKVKSFDRLSVNFRFEQGKARLDNKARKDIQRLADYLKNHSVTIKLIGFGETNDNSAFSQTLARLRADVVKRQLIRAGVPRKSIMIEGYVPEVAMELEVSRLRQIRDRRVEVWVKPTIQFEVNHRQPEASLVAHQNRL